MPTRRYYKNNAPSLTLQSNITSSATNLTVSGSFAGWPTSFPFHATIDFGLLPEEVVLVTAIGGAVATIVRGQDGTSALSHTAGARFEMTVVALDFDEANAHTSANAGVHGVSGSVVGTNDVQTLSNKTLSGPIVTGTLVGASETLSGTSDVTGAATAASYTANGDGKVTGVLVPKSYTNGAAATAALGTPAVGTQVWLTTPTGANYQAGPFYWNGAGWVPLPNGTTGALIGESSIAGASVTLATTSAFAGTGTVTFTLPTQRRVRIEATGRYQPTAATSARCQVRAGYNSGASASIGSFVAVGQVYDIIDTLATSASGYGFGSDLLAAGTYTAYLSVTRITAGNTNDTAGAFYTAVYDAGPV